MAPPGGHMFHIHLYFLHPVNSVNITNGNFSMSSLHVSADFSKFTAGLWEELCLPYTCINSHSQVSDPGPEGPFVIH